MKSSVAALCGLLLLSSILPLSAAETRYVSDQLVITVRGGQERGAATLATLRTGAAVEVLEEEGRYLKIRTADGVEGYVQAQYISSETPKPAVIARLEQERDRLKKQLAQLRAASEGKAGEAVALQARAGEAEEELARSRRELQALTEKHEALLEASRHVVETVGERDRLQDDNERLAAELEVLREENAELLRGGAIRWFLAGAGVLLVGWLLGRAARKKRRGYGYA